MNPRNQRDDNGAEVEDDDAQVEHDDMEVEDGDDSDDDDNDDGDDHDSDDDDGDNDAGGDNVTDKPPAITRPFRRPRSVTNVAEDRPVTRRRRLSRPRVVLAATSTTRPMVFKQKQKVQVLTLLTHSHY